MKCLNQATVSVAVIAIGSLAACSSASGTPQDQRATPDPAQRKSAQPDMPLLTSFREPSEVGRWMVINDGVMGGMSKSSLLARPGSASFVGTVSAENGGGFASIRNLFKKPVGEGLQAVALRVRGDGKRYQFRIRTNKRWDGPAHFRTFDTKAGTWQNVVLPLAEFQASYRGRHLSNVAPLESGAVQQIGFLIADEQYGSFDLEIDSISLL